MVTLALILFKCELEFVYCATHMFTLMMINVHAMPYKFNMHEPKANGAVISSKVNYLSSGLFEPN